MTPRWRIQHMIFSLVMLLTTPAFSFNTISGLQMNYCETVFIQIARDINQMEGLSRRQLVLKKLGKMLAVRKKISFDPYKFINKKAAFHRDLDHGLPTSPDELNSPEAILAYIELRTQINGHDITQLLDLHLNDPKAMTKIIRSASKVKVSNGVSEGKLQNLFSQIYWATHNAQHPQFISLELKKSLLPVGIKVEEKAEIKRKLEGLVKLRAEFAVGKYGVKKAFEDLGILKRSTLTKWNFNDLYEKTFSHMNPVLELILWAPKMISHIMLGLNWNHYFHRALTSPAFIGGMPTYGKRLMDEGWDAVKDEAMKKHWPLAYLESGLERVKNASMSAMMVFFYYITAYALNIQLVNYGVIDHFYIGALTDMYLFWDPIWGSYNISGDIHNFVAPILEQCHPNCEPSIMKSLYIDLYYELPNMFPEDQPALRKLVMDNIWAHLERCNPDCSVEQLQAIFHEIPVELAENMTEFDRKFFVDQLNSAGTVGPGAAGL